LNKGFSDEKPGRDDKNQNKGFLPESLSLDQADRIPLKVNRVALTSR